MRSISTEHIEELKTLKAGESVQLSGIIYTARDAAHKKIMELISENKPLPFSIEGSVIYYAGPTPSKNERPVGSCGPTTSSRMDKFAPLLYSMGMAATIGKGERNEDVVKACREYGGVYLCAIGGAGALCSKSITESEVVAFDELGCESVKKMTVTAFPLIVAIDAEGNDIFKKIK